MKTRRCWIPSAAAALALVGAGCGSQEPTAPDVGAAPPALPAAGAEEGPISPRGLLEEIERAQPGEPEPLAAEPLEHAEAAEAPRPEPALPAASPAPSPSAGAKAAPAASRASGRTYTVRRGDTLIGIARSQYGNPSKVHAIFEANRQQLESPDRVAPGMVLVLP